MPIVRKIIGIGGSRGITIPKDWLDWIERTTGERVIEVTIEVNGVLKVSPVLERRFRQK